MYRDWLQYQLTFTDLSNDDTKQLWEALASCHQGDISNNTRRVLLCDILQGVQTWVQQKISVEIEAVSCKCSSSADTQPNTSTGSDDVALYHLGVWALLSIIKEHKKHIKKSTDEIIQKEIAFLQSLTVLHEKKSDLLPAAMLYLDRGRLTFPHPSLIPFLKSVEERILEILNEANYWRYGKRLHV